MKASTALTTLLLSGIPSAHGALHRSSKVGEEVKTSSGSIKGHASAWKPAVSEYLGVPFAQPPVGPLRFQAPVALKSDGRVEAAKFGASCPANIAQKSDQPRPIRYNGTVADEVLDILGQVSETFDEDCLTLNVWTKPQSGERKKAVLVWIYGGGFNSGGSASPTYNGARLANDEGVVVVSINYRTNILGFPRAPFLKDQNLGLLDQRLALEWVRDNIAQFGGDPSRIVIFGQSAGAVSVDYHAFAWKDDPIVTGYIEESGIASNTPSSNASAGWWNAAAKLGCGTVADGEKTLACVQSKPWRAVLAAIEKRGVSPNLGDGGFSPTPDGKVVFADYTQRRKDGNFAKLPLLIGAASHEVGTYILLARQAAEARGVPHAVAQNINALPNGTAAPQIACGAHPGAVARAQHGVPVWRYVYAGEFPNQNITVPGGAWHGSEIGIVFGSDEFALRKPNTREQEDLSRTVRRVWSDFAKDPSGLARYERWPKYNPDLPTVIKLGGVNSAEIKFVDRKAFDEGCTV